MTVGLPMQINVRFVNPYEIEAENKIGVSICYENQEPENENGKKGFRPLKKSFTFDTIRQRDDYIANFLPVVPALYDVSLIPKATAKGLVLQIDQHSFVLFQSKKSA